MNRIDQDAPFLGSTLGIRLREATAERAVAEMAFRPEVQQLTGLFHTGAILSLADSAATWGSMRVIDPDGTDTTGLFPLAVQLSANLLGNVSSGTIIAEARAVHRGRTMIVMHTEVRTSDGRRLATVTTTHLPLATAAKPSMSERPDGG